MPRELFRAISLFANIGICYAKPIIPEPKTVQKFELRDDAGLPILSIPLWYLPQYDYVFAVIVQRVPKLNLLLYLTKVLYYEKFRNVSNVLC